MFFYDLARRAANAFRFVAIEARGFDCVFQVGERRIYIAFSGALFPKKGGGDHIDASIRGLRRENGRHEQLERIPKVQFAMRVWINFWPGLQQLCHAFASGHAAIILHARPTFQSAFGINGAEGAVRSGSDLLSS